MSLLEIFHFPRMGQGGGAVSLREDAGLSHCWGRLEQSSWGRGEDRMPSLGGETCLQGPCPREASPELSLPGRPSHGGTECREEKDTGGQGDWALTVTPFRAFGSLPSV